jgi:hypothetical protein
MTIRLAERKRASRRSQRSSSHGIHTLEAARHASASSHTLRLLKRTPRHLASSSAQRGSNSSFLSIRQHTSAYVSFRQLPQHTSSISAQTRQQEHQHTRSTSSTWEPNAVLGPVLLCKLQREGVSALDQQLHPHHHLQVRAAEHDRPEGVGGGLGRHVVEPLCEVRVAHL